MNLYVRYFNNETVAKTVDEAMDFLATIPEIRLENNARNRINTFLKSSNLYPFRLKVTFSNYVLFLKTEAETLEAFKEEEARRRTQKDEVLSPMSERKKSIMDALNTEKKGWWLTSLKFKRVITIPESGKCQYVDATFTVKQIANSAMDAYNRIIEHLKNRSDVDPRSQFPSAKSASYEYKFMEEVNQHEVNAAEPTENATAPAENTSTESISVPVDNSATEFASVPADSTTVTENTIANIEENTTASFDSPATAFENDNAPAEDFYNNNAE